MVEKRCSGAKLHRELYSKRLHLHLDIYVNCLANGFKDNSVVPQRFNCIILNKFQYKDSNIMDILSAINTIILYFVLKYNRNFVNSMDKDSNNSLEKGEIGAVGESNEILPEDIKIKTFNLDSKESRINDDNSYEVHRFPQDEAFLYVFNKEAKCIEIRVGDIMLWSYEPDEHINEVPKLVYYKTSPKQMTVYFDDNYSYNYVFRNNKWLVKSGRLNYLTISPAPKRLLVDLDINCKVTTETFKYTDHINKLDTYKTRGGYKFRAVKKGDRELWKSKFTKYADQVDIYRTNNGKIALIVHLENNERALSLKDENEKEDSTEDVSEPEAFLTKVHSRTEERLARNGFKVITADDSDGKNRKENDVTKFVATTITPKSLFLHFNERIKYIELIHKDERVWKYIDVNGDEYIQSLHYVPEDKRIVVWFNDKLPVVYPMRGENDN